MWDSFEILESYVEERVIKIRFVGSINKEIRFREVVSTYDQFWEKKGEKAREEEGCDFCKNKGKGEPSISILLNCNSYDCN